MSVVVTISNPAKLKKAQILLGAKTESETLELALEEVIEKFEIKSADVAAEEDLPEIDVHKLNRIPPKKTIRVKANFKVGGRRKPMKYDFSDFEASENYDG